MLADRYREMIIAPFDKSAVIAGGVYFAEAVTEKNKNAAVRERLGALSEAFSVLSENFYKLSDRRRRPDALGIKKICEASFEKHCEGCQRRDVCWGDEYESTLDAIKYAAGALHRKGEVSVDDISGFEDKCILSKRIITHLNSSLSHATESVIKDDKLGFLASSYDDINALLQDALECDTEELYAVAATNGEKNAILISNLTGETQTLNIEGVDLSGARWSLIDDSRLLSWSPALKSIANNSVVLIEF
jgi:hypothetical protein